jgi:hypothetical protein
VPWLAGIQYLSIQKPRANKRRTRIRTRYEPHTSIVAMPKPLYAHDPSQPWFCSEYA